MNVIDFLTPCIISVVIFFELNWLLLMFEMDILVVTLSSNWGFHSKAIHLFADLINSDSFGVNSRSKSIGFINLIQHLEKIIVISTNPMRPMFGLNFFTTSLSFAYIWPICWWRKYSWVHFKMLLVPDERVYKIG